MTQTWCCVSSLLLRRRPPRATRFPYTTLFRSCRLDLVKRAAEVPWSHAERASDGSGRVPGIAPYDTGSRSAHDTGPYIADSDRKSTRLNSSHTVISYAVFCLKKKIPERNKRVH